jgi:hypothetical protein
MASYFDRLAFIANEAAEVVVWPPVCGVNTTFVHERAFLIDRNAQLEPGKD